MTIKRKLRTVGTLALAGAGLIAAAGCLGAEAEGIAPAQAAQTTVKMDFFHKPLPNIPLPNDIATRYDATSATGRRINASLISPTSYEAHTRKLIDELDGWGVYQPITIPFSGPLDVTSILKGHHWKGPKGDPANKNYALDNNVVYLINVDPKSSERGKVHRLDLGQGNFPVVLESRDKYWKNDPREWTINLLFEEEDEDKNGDGNPDPGEDTDGDGVLDKPNYLPAAALKSGKLPARTDLAGRADALMTFYERQSNTLLLRPLMPLQERTTYAVVVTRRLLDEKGSPVGSPFASINHASQNKALAALPQLLPKGLALQDVAFAFSFTTQTVQSDMQAARDGLYGNGIQAHLAADFPARVATLEKLKNPAFKKFKGMKNAYIVHNEHLVGMVTEIAGDLLGMNKSSEEFRLTLEYQNYVDYHVMGSFKSPQLFGRKDKNGEMLPYNDQAWPADLDHKRAKAHSEDIYFWITVPRKEVSARKDGKPVPVVILSHGYGGNRVDILTAGGIMAKHGFAAVSIDGPGHGLALGKTDYAKAKAASALFGLNPFFDAVFKSRAFDQNFDGNADSGADFWSAYVFHTRDNVRQFALDYMQLIRVLRTFDGSRKWSHDVNGDGTKELAGDFDADGKVDIGGPAVTYHMTGGSLGGIMSMATGALEPHLNSVAPVAGGAGLGDVGIRSRQGGVPEAFILRVLGPLFVGTLDAKSSDGELKLEMVIPDLNSTRSLHFATVKGVAKGDTVVVQNLTNGEKGCSVVGEITDDAGKVKATGVRLAVATDAPRRCDKQACPDSFHCWRNDTDPKTQKSSKRHYIGDLLKVSIYKGPVIVGEKCKLKAGATAAVTVSTFENEVKFQQMTCDKAKPLISLIEGLGKRRVHPELRRFANFASFVIEPGDPVAYMRHLSKEPLTFLGDKGVKEQTGTHALIITTAGDMNVPASSGLTAGRTAGIIEYLKDDPRHGKSNNQALIDTYTAEAVNTYKRYTNATSGVGVHLDVENFSRGSDMWGKDLPRLAQPLHIGVGRKDPLGGESAAIFPLTDETGQHGFSAPGNMTDKARAKCKKECNKTGGSDPCGCKTLKTFDVGMFMYNMIGQYFASQGKAISTDLCNSRNDCKGFAAPLKARDPATLPF